MTTTQTPAPTAGEIRQELERLLDDAAFRRAPTHSRLLRYLVERKAAGDDGALCEAGIAMAVFQRDPASYDAETDPIVRVSIGRLRDRLARHYQQFRQVPSTIILLPKGRYVPEFTHRAHGSAAMLRGLGVMRTSNLTGDPRFDALAQAFSDRLSEALVLMGLSRVIPPASVQSAQNAANVESGHNPSGHHQSPVDVARTLGVSEIIETTLSPEAGDRLRLSARLIRAADSELAWAEVRTVAHDNPYPGIDALFDAVLARFAAAPGMRASAAPVAAGNRAALPPAARGNVDAARMLLTHLDVSSIQQARELLIAVTHDFPDAADAWALRARSCVRRLNFADVDARSLIDELHRCVNTAMALNPEHIEGRALRALVSHWDGRLAESEVQFRDVLRSAPNHTAARLGFAWLLTAQGRFDEALTELDAASSFDPMSLNVLLNRGWVLGFARRHDESRLILETGMRAGGPSPFALMAAADNELWAGELDRAETLYARARDAMPDSRTVDYSLACIAALRGDVEKARALQRAASDGDGSPPNFFQSAVLSACLSDRDATIGALRQVIANRESGRLLLGINRFFEWLADDPEFIAVLGLIGLRGWCGARATSEAHLLTLSP